MKWLVRSSLCSVCVRVCVCACVCVLCVSVRSLRWLSRSRRSWTPTEPRRTRSNASRASWWDATARLVRSEVRDKLPDVSAGPLKVLQATWESLRVQCLCNLISCLRFQLHVHDLQHRVWATIKIIWADCVPLQCTNPEIRTGSVINTPTVHRQVGSTDPEPLLWDTLGTLYHRHLNSQKSVKTRNTSCLSVCYVDVRWWFECKRFLYCAVCVCVCRV